LRLHRTPQTLDFDREIYGRVPKVTPQVKWEVTSTTPGENGDVDIITKHLTGVVDNSSYPDIFVHIDLTLVTQADAKGPVPVIMQFGGGGFGPPAMPGAAPSPPSDGPPYGPNAFAVGRGLGGGAAARAVALLEQLPGPQRWQFYLTLLRESSIRRRAPRLEAALQARQGREREAPRARAAVPPAPPVSNRFSPGMGLRRAQPRQHTGRLRVGA
jgi:hypothetical protein